MRQLLLFCLLFFLNLNYSQNHELGEVTVDELSEKAYAADTSAVAAVLFDVGKTSFVYSGDDGFQIVTEIQTKIKIYKKEGYGYGNQVLNYYVGGTKDEIIYFTKATTYNLVNGKIEKTKLNSDGEFIEKINKLWSSKKIAMPNVKVGSIIEFKIYIKSPYIWNFPEWEFQKEIPVKYSEYTTYIPEYFNYNTYLKGFYSPSVSNNSKTRKMEYTYTEDVIPGAVIGMPRRIHTNVEFKESSSKYVLENVPASKEETYVNNIDNYQVTLLHELSATRFPNEPYQNFTTDWESVAKKVYDGENFGNELRKTGYFEKDIDALLKSIVSNEEKIAAIFVYVKSRMNWDGSYGYFCEEGVRKAYQNKKGNPAEINLMLTAMLRYAGFEANPILISTRSNGISMFPSQTSFNYVIAGVEIENQVILFDATNKYALPNILPIHALNWYGRMIRKNGSSEQVGLMPNSNSREILNVMATINPKGEIMGKVRDQYYEYNSLVFRDNNNAIQKENYIEKLEKSHQGLEIIAYDVQNKIDLSKPVIESYSFTNDNSIEIIGDKMYFSPFLFFAMTENPFKQETREYPVDFIFPNQKKVNISINIPDGYVLEILPLVKAITMPDGLGNFKYNIVSNGNQIQLLYNLDINQAVIGAEYYEILKNFFKEIVDKQTEKIVLKKV